MRNPFTIISLMIIAAMVGLLYTFGWTPWTPASPEEAVVVEEEVMMEPSSSSKAAVRSSVRSESIQPVQSSRAPAAVIKEEVEVEVIPAPVSSVSSAPVSRAAVSVVSSVSSQRPPVNVITLPAKSSSSEAPAGGAPEGSYRTTGD